MWPMGGGERMSSTVTEALLHSDARPTGAAGEIALHRAERTILVVDVVEFGRLAEVDEVDTVTRWFGLVGTIQSDILPAHGARLVKELGDGLLIELCDVPAAVATALAIRALARRRNAGLLHDRQMRLRMGIEHAMVIVDHGDLHGSAVTLAARLAALAGPGEIIVSAAVRDRLVPSLDAEVEDLGPCYLKHRSEPVRAFRVGPPGARTGLPPALAATALQPTLAVLPFATADLVPELQVIGEVLAGEVICHLSSSAGPQRHLRAFQLSSSVIARSISPPFASIWVPTTCFPVATGSRLAGWCSMPNSPRRRRNRSSGPAADRAGQRHSRHDREIAAQLVADVGLAVIAREVERAQCRPLPTLQAYTLLLGAVALMHRLSPADFEQARAMLETLIERAPRQCVPQAWLAKWHVLNVQQGWSTDQMRDAAKALELTRRALDTNPQCTLAWRWTGWSTPTCSSVWTSPSSATTWPSRSTPTMPRRGSCAARFMPSWATGERGRRRDLAGSAPLAARPASLLLRVARGNGATGGASLRSGCGTGRAVAQRQPHPHLDAPGARHRPMASRPRGRGAVRGSRAHAARA
jgi:adenylate cyclase